MGVILVKDGDSICDNCISNADGVCIDDYKPYAVNHTIVGVITRCDGYITENMVE